MTKLVRIALVIAFIIFLGGIVWSYRANKAANEVAKKTEKKEENRQAEITTSTRTEPASGFSQTSSDTPAPSSQSSRPVAPRKQPVQTNPVTLQYYYIVEDTNTGANASASASASGSSASASASSW